MCHPFYTGTQKIVDTAGRVDRFRQKYGMKDKAPVKTEAKAAVTAEKAEVKADTKAKPKAKKIAKVEVKAEEQKAKADKKDKE